MQGILVENFAMTDWRSALSTAISKRYPNAHIELQRPQVVLVRLRSDGERWDDEGDGQFWASLKAERIIQRWTPLETVPPPAKHNKALFEDIGYRVGSGERLTSKQQEVLFAQLLALETRALQAEAEAKEQRYAAEEAREHEKSMIERHNAVVGVLHVLDGLLGIETRGDIDEPMTITDHSTGLVIARDAPLAEAYGMAVFYRLAKEHKA